VYEARKNQFVTRVAILASCLSLSFMQSVLFVDAQVPAQEPPKTDAPVDIQATEQEFADDQVIAKGNVVVTYKESIVHAPLARLFRDASGQAQRAVFVGHPNLLQGANKINADTLIFEIANSKVVAQGHAHSEVISSGDDNAMDMGAGSKPGAGSGAKPGAKPAGKETTGGTKVAMAPPAPVKMGANGVPQIQWPKAGDEQQAKSAPEPTPAAAAPTSTPDSTSAVEHFDANAPTVDANGNPVGTVDEFAATANRTQKKNAAGAVEAVEKIITDSDYQEYEKAAGKFDAIGNVHVIHGDISVFANKLQLVYGLDGKPETALFTGAVNATQGTNNTKSDMMTYYLATKRLQATGNVRSKVIQNKPADDKNDKTKKPGEKGKDTKVVGSEPKANGGAANATAKPTGSQTAAATKEEDILVLSDAQDYSKDSGRMAADGNVHVYYEETTGMGPHVILLKDEFGKAQTIIFTGRSQISQPGKKWIADKITFTVANKKVLAEGNTKAYLVQQTKDVHALPSAPSGAPSTTAAVASSPKPNASDTANGGTKTSISASKAEETR
jgi:lipopolysaccharide export system protein LptA